MFGGLIEKSTLQVLISPTWGRVRTNATRCKETLADAMPVFVRLAAFDLKYAHTVVGDGIAVGGALGGPLQRRPLLCGENVSERGLHLIEGLAVLGPELAQSLVASEGLWDWGVAHLAVLGVNPDQAFYVPVFLQLPQRLDETVRHLLGHTLGPFSCGHGL